MSVDRHDAATAYSSYLKVDELLSLQQLRASQVRPLSQSPFSSQRMPSPWLLQAWKTNEPARINRPPETRLRSEGMVAGLLSRAES